MFILTDRNGAQSWLPYPNASKNISSLKMSARRCNLCATLAQLRDLRGKRKVYCGLLGIISRKNFYMLKNLHLLKFF